MRYLLAMTALLCVPMAASGEIIVCIESKKVPASPNYQDVALEVFVQSNEQTSPKLIGFQLHIGISPAGAGLAFKGGQPPSEWRPIDHPYVFPSQTPIVQIEPGSASVYGGDFLLSGWEYLDNNDGLLRLPFGLAGGTPAGSVFDVILDPDPQKSFLERDNVLAPIEFTIHNGQVRVIVPEPQTLMLSVVFGVALLFWRRSRRTVHSLL